MPNKQITEAVERIQQGLEAASFLPRRYEHESHIRPAIQRGLSAAFGYPPAIERKPRSVDGPDLRKWKPDLAVYRPEYNIAIEVKLFDSAISSSNYHAELARGLGQCLIYSREYTASVLLLVHQGSRRPHRLWGPGESTSPIMVRTPGSSWGAYSWIYNFDRWHQL